MAAQRLPKADVLSTGEGFSIRDIRAIAQDNLGLMWFGTSQGIERYDGQYFVKYGSANQADFPFPGNDVSNEDMLLFNDSSIWTVADGILFSIDLATQNATDLSRNANLSGKIYSLRQAADSTIWLVTDDDREQHLYRHTGNLHFEQVATAEHLRMPFNDLGLDSAGNAWWSTNAEGLRKFSPDGELLHSVRPDSIIWYGTKIYYTNIHVDSKDRLFVFTKSVNQIRLYHPESRQYDLLADSLSARVYSGLEDSRGNLWFATFDGLLRWKPSGEWTDFTGMLHKATQFTNIRHLFEDQTHLLWIATDNGLLRFPIGRNLFQNYLTVPGTEWGNTMRGIFADQEGSIYAFCENGQNGLHLLDRATLTGQLTFPFHDTLREKHIMDHVTNIVFDKKGNTAWTLNDKLIKVNMAGIEGTVEADFTTVSSQVSRNPLSLLKDGSIVLGSVLDKTSIYNPVTKERSFLITNPQWELPATTTEVIREGPNGWLWIGTTTAGLFCFDRTGKKLAHFSTDSNPAISNNHILSLLFDRSGQLWIGTFGGGLNHLDLPTAPSGFQDAQNLNLGVHTQSDGLCDNNVVSILEDNDGNIWAATYNGLSCYLRSEGTFRNFYEEDGLSNNEFNYASYFKDDQGGMWFGGMNGINYFDPKNILQGEKNPPICLTGFTKYNSKKDSTTVQVIGNRPPRHFDISPHVNWFQFNWALPNYFKPDKSHYYVMLEGFDGNWTNLGSTPFVRYNKLPPGDYTLRVKGSDSKANWGEGEMAITICVHPFYYQTWWFYLSVLIVVAGIGFAISRYHLQRLLEMERMRTRIASDLHDEVGSMLSGLAMQTELLEMTAPEKDRSRLSNIAEISRTAVSKMRDMVWSIDSRRDKLKNLLERMQEQAADFLQPRDISYQFELGELPLDKKLPVDIRQHLYLIFKEALNNVVRHSGASEVVVRFGNFDGQFELGISDNGTPPKKEKISTGLGLSNMEMRAGLLGGKLRVEQAPGFSILLTMKAL